MIIQITYKRWMVWMWLNAEMNVIYTSPVNIGAGCNRIIIKTANYLVRQNQIYSLPLGNILVVRTANLTLVWIMSIFYIKRLCLQFSKKVARYHSGPGDLWNCLLFICDALSWKPFVKFSKILYEGRVQRDGKWVKLILLKII